MSMITQYLAEIGRQGGLKTSEKKAKAARKNGRKGGKPRTYPKCRRYGSHRFSPETGRCPCGYRRKESP